jgi:hypothetical protein
LRCWSPQLPKCAYQALLISSMRSSMTLRKSRSSDSVKPKLLATVMSGSILNLASPCPQWA